MLFDVDAVSLLKPGNSCRLKQTAKLSMAT